MDLPSLSLTMQDLPVTFSMTCPKMSLGETFWVRITDNVDPSSSCFTDLDETIVDDPDEIIVTNATVTDSDQCSPSNGAIEVTAITINGAATNSAAGFEALETAGYTFDVLQSDATTLEKTFNIAADGGTGTFPTADGLDPDTYFVRITNDLSCTSALYQFTIDDISVAPALNASEAAASSVCAGGSSPDGSATVTVTNAGGSTDYDYQWYTGTSAIPANIINAGYQCLCNHSYSDWRGSRRLYGGRHRYRWYRRRML